MTKVKKRMNLRDKIKVMFNITLYPYQELFLYDCMESKRVVGAFCRQTGKSLTISILAVVEALKNPGGHVIIIGPTDRQAGELFEKIRNHIRNAPIGTEVASATQRQMVMKNNCRISAFPCGDTGDNIRGMTGNVVILEEAAFIKDSIVNQVITPMVAATNGKIIKISTPFGMNHFYRSFQQDENYISHRYTWKHAVKCNHFTESFIDEQRLQCSSLEFATEYEAEFIADEDAYFPHKLIESCISDYELFTDTSIDIMPKEYYLGVDFARMGDDSSVYVVIEKSEVSKVVMIKEVKKNTMDEAIDYIKFLHAKYKFRKIIADQTGLGAGAVDVLARDLNSPFVNKPATYGNNPNQMDVVVGLTFTQKSKQDVFSNLKLLMEQKKLMYPNNKKLIYELKDFRYEISASGNLKLHHSEGGHDDFVDALACAAHGLRGIEHSFFFG